MVKRLGWVGLVGLFLIGPQVALGNSIFNRAPQFTVPAGAIAFMGCYWSPLTILSSGGGGLSADAPAAPGAEHTLFNSGNVHVGIDTSKAADLLIGDEAPPEPGLATSMANQSVLEKGGGLGLSIAPVTYSVPYQNALLMHILNPAKWAYNPGLTKYAGNKPYLLIGIIDQCVGYPSSVKIREKQNDQPISYFGKRSILEQDTDVFANKGAQHVVALEFFLVSTATGITVWQGNVITTGGKMAGYDGILAGLVENALKNLMKK